LAAAMEGLGTDVRNKEFSVQASWIPILSLFCPFSQQSRISEESSKNINLMNRKTDLGCKMFPAVYDTKDWGSM
jgi:hypothetical protein